MKVGGKDTRLILPPQYGSARTITKNYRGVSAPRGKIQCGGLYFRTHHKDGLVHAGFDKLVSYRQCVNESGTCIADVQRCNAFEAKFTLKQHTGSGKEKIGRAHV